MNPQGVNGHECQKFNELNKNTNLEIYELISFTMRLTDSNYASFKVKRTKMVFITGGGRGDLDPVSRTNFREIHAGRISKGKLQIPLLFYKVSGKS